MKKSTLINDTINPEPSFGEIISNWQTLADVLPNPVFFISCDHTVMMANCAAADLVNLKSGNYMHIKYYQLMHGTESPMKNCPLIKSLKSGKVEQIETYEPHMDKYLSLNASPVFRGSVIKGVVYSVLDITEQKISEQSSDDLIDIYARSVNELKMKEIRAQKGRDAFLNMLEDISESYRDLEDLFLKMVVVMVNVLDAKSPWTKGHSERVSMYAEQIAQEMSLDDDEVKDIKLAGLLHDIGKIGTYDYLLDKPGRLTKEEFDIVKKHPEEGGEILKEIKQLRDIIPYIKYHHEKLDGNGYPHKLKGETIPLGARIMHVADSFDSMTSDRPYRAAPGLEYALSELEKFSGTQFDHHVVEAFLEVLRKSDTLGS